MNYFGQKSLSSTLKTLFKILFYISIVVSLLSIVVFLIIYFMDPRAKNILWSFTINGLILSMNNFLGNYHYFILFLNYLLMIPLIWIFKKMCVFFGFLSENIIFTTENFQILKSTGFILLITGLLKSFVNFLSVNGFFNYIQQSRQSLNLRLSFSDPWNFMVKTFDFGNYSIGYSLASEMGIIITGLSIIFFANLFKQALLIKEENDFTI